MKISLIAKALSVGTSLLFVACTTLDLENQKQNIKDYTPFSLKNEEEINEQEMKNLMLLQELDEAELVKIEQDNKMRIAGKEAVEKSLEKATQKPEHYKNGTFIYTYNENLVYEVYAQPYHLTDIVLEDGEMVIGTPLLSEDETVWELTAGVGRNAETGEDIQHLFIKPTYSAQDSSLIIITDRRVYHFRIKSFKDTHMAIVKFNYPQTKNRWAKSKQQKILENAEIDFSRVSNPEFLSFDYKIKYSRFKKPEFLPTRVFDDGQATYIQLDESVLQKELPLLFNEKQEITNYVVRKNVLIVPRLINTMTLRLGKQKVTVIKKLKK